jgi:hypothetical protein
MLFDFGVKILQPLLHVLARISGDGLFEFGARELLLVADFFGSDTVVDGELDGLEKELRKG